MSIQNENYRRYVMKLLVVMSIEAHANEIRKLFVQHQVPVYSEAPISGFRLPPAAAHADNWFADRHVQVYSHLIFAFVQASKAGELLDAVRTLSAEMAEPNPIRAFQLSVDKFI